MNHGSNQVISTTLTVFRRFWAILHTFVGIQLIDNQIVSFMYLTGIMVFWAIEGIGGMIPCPRECGRSPNGRLLTWSAY